MDNVDSHASRVFIWSLRYWRNVGGDIIQAPSHCPASVDSMNMHGGRCSKSPSRVEGRYESHIRSGATQ